jgi:small nuclear ribonucleoprotein (snRNP)-like protein
VLRGFDQFMNIVLDNTVDTKLKQDIGMVVSALRRAGGNGGVRALAAYRKPPRPGSCGREQGRAVAGLRRQSSGGARAHGAACARLGTRARRTPAPSADGLAPFSARSPARPPRQVIRGNSIITIEALEPIF